VNLDSRAASVADVVAAVHRRYPPQAAEAWDAVGLVCGDPGAEVRRILVAVDVVAATVEEAFSDGAELLITHHPLLLHPVTSVAATTPAGSLVQRLVGGGCALLAAHTNADVARDGVNDALAAALGLGGTAPLMPSAGDPSTGLGRVGTLTAPMSLGAFADHVRDSLPATAGGVRIAGDLESPVHRVAVIGGSGGDALAAARAAGVDVVVTSDLKHHVTQDHLAAGGPALLDVAHFASEWPWVPQVVALLKVDLAAYDIEIRGSTLVTDPWTGRV
jgi:dinuclear metal center YbgI/SA1388 family protein